MATTKKKAKLKVIEGGKAKKAKTSAVPERTTMITEFDGRQTKLLASCDAAEAAIEAAKEKFGEALANFVDALGSSSFNHPERGPMSIMSRNGQWFWRRKPTGGPKGVKRAKAATKKAEAAPAKKKVKKAA